MFKRGASLFCAVLGLVGASVGSNLDSSFGSGAGANGPVRALAVLPDDSVLVGGEFTEFHGVLRAGIARLTSDGLIDSNFVVVPNVLSSVHSIAVQEDGRILLASMNAGAGGAYVVRLNGDGKVDESFVTTVNGPVHGIALGTNGSIWLGGDFTEVNGMERNRIVRLNMDGTVDLGFDPDAGANGAVLALLPDPDGGILLGGEFSAVGTNAVGRLARLAHDGSFDGTFYTRMIPSAPGYAVRCIVRLGDGKLIVGGKFSLYDPGRINIHGIIRLLPSGASDFEFTSSIYATTTGTTGVVHAVVVEPSGRMIAAGDFQSFNDRPQPNLVRLSPDGTTDTCFVSTSTGAPNGAVFALAQQTVDRVLAGGNFTTVGAAARGGAARFVAAEPPPVVPAVTLVPSSGWPRVGMNGTTTIQTDVQNCGGRLSYQWYRNGVALGSAESPYFEGRSSQLLLSHWRAEGPFPGDYFVTVSNSVGVTTSAVVHVDVGMVDSTFNPTNGPFLWQESPVISAVLCVLPGNDGGVLAGGRFTQVEETNWAHLAQFRADGSLDRTFTARPNRPVYTMVRQPDGRILIGGEFNGVNGVFRDRVARLEPDGSLDTNFQTSLGRNGTIHSMVVQPDGKILVAGVFSIPLPSGGYMHHLARLETNGAVDFSFNAGTNLYGLNTTLHFARSVLVLDDGRILVGGSFHRAVGSSRDYLARFLPDGTIDPTYGTAPLLGPSGPITTLARAPGGPIYVGGSFTNFNGVGTTNIARLLPDGTWDESFRLQFASSSRPVQTLAIDSGGNVFAVTGDLFVNMSMSGIRKFDSNGRWQTNFVGPALPTDNRSGIHCLALLPDGRMFIGGNFEMIDRQLCRRIARLPGPSDGPPEIAAISPSRTIEGGYTLLLSATVTAGSASTQVQWFQNGLAVPGETNVFFIRVESEPSISGEYWIVASNQFGMSTSTVATVTVRPAGRPGSVVRSFVATPGPDSNVLALAESHDGKVYVGGSFTNYHGLPRYRTVRIDERGALDAAFVIPASAGNWLNTTALYPMSDGKVLVGGSPFQYSAPVRRYLADGSLDSSWRLQNYAYPPSASNPAPFWFNSVVNIALDRQGGIYVGGSFFSVLLSGVPDRRYRYAVRLFPDGLLDTSFKVDMLPRDSFCSAGISGLSMDADDHPLVWGNYECQHIFLNYKRFIPGLHVYRLNSIGQRESREDGPTSGGGVHSVRVQPDGKLLVAGIYDYGEPNFPIRFVRFFADGTQDTSFQAWPPPDGYTYHKVLALQTDGKVLATIFSYQATNNTYNYTNRLVRLHINGSLDTSFDVGDGYNGIAEVALVRQDGNILVGGRFTRFSGHYCNNIALLHGGSPRPPSVSHPAESRTVVAGDALHLSALVDGFPPPQLQWLRNGVAIPGATQQSFRLRSTGWDDAGVYSLLASNASGVSTSIVATVSVQAGRLDSDWVDSGFSAGSEPDGEIHVIVPQADGRVLIGGQFTRVGGVPRPGIARLLADGRLDESFVPSPDFSTPSFDRLITVSRIVVMPDGKVAASRTFTTFNFTVQNDMIRLHEDGRLDTSFTNQLYRIPLLAMPDGRLLIGRGLQMLAADGTVDGSFVAATNLGSFISQASLLADGRILVSAEGNGIIERLLPDGERDVSFDRSELGLSSGSSNDICFPPSGGVAPGVPILAQAVQPDGKVIIGGVFSKYMNRYTANLLRLLPSGRIDPGFSAWTQTDYAIRAIAVQPDGKILIGGCFTNVGTYPSMVGRLHLARLHPDGSVDAAFDPAPTYRGSSGGYVRTMALQSDGCLLIGGSFDSVNGATRRNLARLNGDLTLFQTATAASGFTTQIKTVQGRNYWLERRDSLDGEHWTAVQSVAGDGSTQTLTDSASPAIQRFYRVRAE